jgi:putative SOS response-associated peptidase YedK
MCGRFVFFRSQGLASRFGVPGQMPLFEAAYNITPESLHPVIVGCHPSAVSLMKWGLIPYWAKDPKIGYTTINARAEGIQNKPSFRRPLRSQRCLVPIDGFYEWQKTTVAGRQTKVPHFIHLKDGETFALAGLYDVWRDAEGREIPTFTIVTTGPNELMATIHNRMPVILPREVESVWLDPTTPLPQVLALLQPYPAAGMGAYPVSNLVNSPRNGGRELIEPLPTAKGS